MYTLTSESHVKTGWKTHGTLLRGRFGLFFFFDCLTAFTELFLAAFGAAGFALLAGDDINDDMSAVLAALRARAVCEVFSAAFATDHLRRRDSVMAPALPGLGTIATHSYYHIEAAVYPEILCISSPRKLPDDAAAET